MCLAGGISLGYIAKASTPASTRPATAGEAAFCQANYEQLGPITGDCHKVPLAGGIEEDDPWGRWDCRTMGNHVCGSTIYFNLAGQLHGFDLNAPDRPGCFAEPSATHAGFEVIWYGRISAHTDEFGFEVNCPM